MSSKQFCPFNDFSKKIWQYKGTYCKKFTAYCISKNAAAAMTNGGYTRPGVTVTGPSKGS